MDNSMHSNMHNNMHNSRHNNMSEPSTTRAVEDWTGGAED